MSIFFADTYCRRASRYQPKQKAIKWRVMRRRSELDHLQDAIGGYWWHAEMSGRDHDALTGRWRTEGVGISVIPIDAQCMRIFIQRSERAAAKALSMSMRFAQNVDGEARMI